MKHLIVRECGGYAGDTVTYECEICGRRVAGFGDYSEPCLSNQEFIERRINPIIDYSRKIQKDMDAGSKSMIITNNVLTAFKAVKNYLKGGE